MDEANDTYTNAQLTVELGEDERNINVRLLGKSILHDPTEFIMPILQEAIGRTSELNKRLIIDFTDLQYMNSSTLTPFIKVLEKARVGTGKISLKYENH